MRLVRAIRLCVIIISYGHTANLSTVSYSNIFGRGCVKCPDTTPSCPDTCPDGQECSIVPVTCDTCQHTVCVATGSSSDSSSPAPASSKGPNVGAIAGGVVGGLVVIAVATYFVWRYCIKAKRQQYQQAEWTEHGNESRESEKEDFTMRRDARASTHTVGSIASTVLTRASNIIQIAYIPGVTNRSAPSTPGVLVPPVPPIPIALSSTSASSPGHEESEHFFMPGALRDSTYSGISDRTSYARNSVASTIYGKNAVVSPVPAQTVIRGKAAMVSVRQNGGRSGEATPPVPSVDYDRFGSSAPPASPAFSVGSTFLNSATTATQVKAVSIKTVGSNATLKSQAQKQAQADTPQVVVTGADGAVTSGGHDRESAAVTIIDDTPSLEQGPFSDPPLGSQSPANQSTTTLGAVIEDKKEEKRDDDKEVVKESTPFGDEHALKE